MVEKDEIKNGTVPKIVEMEDNKKIKDVFDEDWRKRLDKKWRILYSANG